VKVALAYSGGLDTTVAIKWLKEKYGADTITVTVDVGQEEDFELIRERAYACGALRHYHIDAKERFTQDFISRAIKANALYEREYPLSSALSRPLIAEEVVKVAFSEACDAVAHGSTGKGNDQLRFDTTFAALAPNLKIIAPVREWNMNRDDEIAYAIRHGLPVDVRKSRFSVDENLWGRSIEAGELEDTWVEPPDEAFKVVSRLSEAAERPEEVVISFDEGVPTALNNSKMKLSEVVHELNRVGGRHAFGIVDHVEDRVIGVKSREVYEVPAALMLIRAHMDLEKMVIGRRMLAFKQVVDQVWTDLVYSGLWADPFRRALDAFIDESQKNVSGDVRVRLHRGAMRIVGRRAERPMYSKEIITYSKESVFDQKAGEGFSRIWGLETQLGSMSRVSQTKKIMPQ